MNRDGLGIEGVLRGLDAPTQEAVLDLYDQMGAKWVRIGAYWPEIDAAVTGPADIAANRDWSAFDAAVTASLAHSKTIIVSLLGYAAWANGSAGAWFVPGDPGDMAADLSDHADFAGAVIAHCEAIWPGQITHYEIWNEADTGQDNFWTNLPAANDLANPSMDNDSNANGEPDSWWSLSTVNGTVALSQVAGDLQDGPYAMLISYDGVPADGDGSGPSMRVVAAKDGYAPGDPVSGGMKLAGTSTGTGAVDLEVGGWYRDPGTGAISAITPAANTAVTLTSSFQWVTASGVIGAGCNEAYIAVRVHDPSSAAAVRVKADSATLVKNATPELYGSGRVPLWSDPAKFAAMVKGAYTAIKAVNAGAIVSVAFSSIACSGLFVEDFYACMALLGGTTANKFYFDVPGAHPYCDDRDPTTDAPAWIWDSGKMDRNFMGLPKLKALIDSFEPGADKHVICTEFGYRTGGSTPVTEAVQAAYLILAYQMALAWPWLDAMLWYGFYCGTGHADQVDWSLVNPDLTLRPSGAAFAAIAAAPSVFSVTPSPPHYGNPLQLIVTDRAGVDHDLTHISEGLRFSGAAEGGCADLSVTCKLPLDRRRPEFDLLNVVEVWDVKQMRSIWHGRIRETPRHVSDDEGVEIVATGPYHDTLQRRTTQGTWLDIDFGHLAVQETAEHGQTAKFTADTGNRLLLQVQDGISYKIGDYIFARMRLPYGKIHRCVLAGHTNFNATYFNLEVWDQRGRGAGTLLTEHTSNDHDFTWDSGSGNDLDADWLDFAFWCKAAVTGADTFLQYAQVNTMAVYGTTGAVTGSQVFKDCLTAIGAGEVSQDFSLIQTAPTSLPSFAERDPAPIGDIVGRANAIDRLDYGFVGDGRAFMRPRPTAAKYFCRLDLGATFDWTPTVDGLTDYADVQYASTSVADWDKSNLFVVRTGSSPELTAAGVHASSVLSSPVKDLAQAQALGDAYNSEHGVLRPAGTLTLHPGEVFDANGAPVDPWLLVDEPGEMIQILDLLPTDEALDAGYDARTTGRIAMADWSEEDQTLTVTLDSSEFTFEALMERMAANNREPTPAHPTIDRLWCRYYRRWETHSTHKKCLAHLKKHDVFCSWHKHWETKKTHAAEVRARRKKK
jgi:hypothetical protein